jgi:hypothetical protein
MRARIFLFLAAAVTAVQAQTPQWGVWERRFTLDTGNPDQAAVAHLRGPNGESQAVEAFWDGGRTWVVRFSPDQPGRWTFNLEDQRGSFTVEPSDDPGPVSLSADRRYLQYANGKPFFWLADTAWNGAIRATDEEWKRYLDDRKAKGFTGIQFVMTQWRAAPDVRAYYTGSTLRLNPQYFRQMDRRFHAIQESGLVAIPVLLWAIGGRNSIDPGYALPEAQAVKLARYMVARYGAYRVIWMLGGDGEYRAANSDKWKRIGRRVFPAGSPRRPVTLHPRGMNWPWEFFEDEPWLDFVTYQSGHGNNDQSRRWNTIEVATLAAKLRIPRPVINAEPNYETHLDYHEQKPITDFQVRRAAYWSLLVHPPAGVTYGAHGIWFWSRKAEIPTDHPRSGMALPWWESLDLPGAQQMKILRDLFDSIEWWRLRPDQTLLAEPIEDPFYFRYITAARSDSGDLALLYLPDNPQVTVDLSRLSGPVRAQWVDPRYGVRYEAGLAPGSGPRTFTRPTEGDWVLLLQVQPTPRSGMIPTAGW